MIVTRFTKIGLARFTDGDARKGTPLPLSRAIAGAVGLVVALCTTAAPASAQMVCGSFESITKRLADGYQESMSGVGLGHNGAAVLLFTSEAGTFSILLRRPNGLTCLMAVGQDWQAVKVPPHATGASLSVPSL